MFKISNTQKRGFTLVEMIVSFGLFTLVMMVSIGALLSIANATRYGNSTRFVIDNITFALDSMSRTLRTGSSYTCIPGAYNASATIAVTSPGRDCTTGGFAVAFIDQSGVEVAYRLREGTLEVKRGDCAGGTCTAGIWRALTSPFVSIENTDSIAFYVQNTSIPILANQQARAIIHLRGRAGTRPTLQATFNIQTTISQRALEQ